MNRFLTSLFAAVTLLCPTASAVAAPPGVKRTAGTDPGQVLQRAADPKSDIPMLLNRAVGLPDNVLHRALTRQGLRKATASTPAFHALAYTTDLIGQVRYSPTLGQNKYYRIPHASGTDFTELGFTYYNLNFGSYYDAPTNTVTGVASQILFGEPTFIYLLTYDATTFEELSRLEVSVDMMALGADRDEASGRVYGYYYNTDLSHAVWGEGNYQTGERRAIKDVPLSEVCQAVVAAADGYHYGIRVADAKLVRIDRETGAQTAVGTTAVPTNYTPAYCMYPRNNSMLVLAVAEDQSDTSLYEVDLTSGATAVLSTYPMAQFTQLFIAAPLADDKAPEAPALTLSAPEGTMTVNVSLTLPQVLMDQTPVQGNLNWNIMVNGESRFSGSDAAGSSVEKSVTMTEAGYVTFEATASNSTGSSPVTTARIFVGQGCPAAPGQPSLSWADGTMSLTWLPVESSADGGYVDPQSVTYDVTVNDVTLATGLTECSYSWTLAMPENRMPYTASVVAHYDGKASAPALSNTVNLGPFSTPFHTLFNSTDTFDEYNYTVVDANEDGRTWTPQTSGARYYYSSTLPADDWLFTPGIRLQSGKAYKLDIDVASDNSTYTERVEVKAGIGANPKNMVLNVIAPSEVPAVLRDGTMRLTGMVVPSTDGVYNLGVHAISDKDRYLLWLTELALGEGMDVNCPAAPAPFTLTPDSTGLNSVTGSVRLPSKSVTDTDLSGTVSLSVTCGDRTVATLSGTPGQTLTFTDTLPQAGTYTYTATPSVGSLIGVAATATAYVGPYAPAAPAAANVAETATPGTVTVTWDAVTADVNDSQLAADQLTYMVYSIDSEKNLTPCLSEPTAQTSVTFAALPENAGQDFVQYAVYAFNRGLKGQDGTLTNLIAVGTPYQMPVRISSEEDLDNYIVGVDNTGGATIGVASAEDLSVPACDDDLLFYSYSYYYYRHADLFTGKVSIGQASHPQFSFYTWRHADDDEDTIDVYVLHDGEQTLATTAEHAAMKAGEWNRVKVDLSDYRGKDIQILLRFTTESYSYILADDLRIQDVPEYDVAAEWITAPVNAQAETPFTVSVQIGNYGYKSADGVTVDLYRDNEPVDSKTIAMLMTSARMPVAFEQEFTYFDADPTGSLYHAVVSMTGDSDPGNDACRPVRVNRPASQLEPVADLVATSVDGGVRLDWTPYSIAGRVATPVTDDFEDGESYADHYGDWTFVDNDQAPIGLITPVPGLTTGESAVAFIVFDNSNDAYSAANFQAASGHKYLMGFYNYDWSDNDDWAISPKLSGQAQAIAFYAKSFRNDYRESFEVRYTTEDSVSPQSYTLLATEEYIPGTEWTRYEYQLPEGATHFAIHYISSNAYMIMIDDVTYTPDPTAGALTLTGYDVYRDGVKVTDAPVDGGTWLDTDVTAGTHTYHLVARYAQGSSDLSNGAVVDYQVGVNHVSADKVSVTAQSGRIDVKGAGTLPVTVSAADATLVHASRGDISLRVAPGVYMVTVGRNTFKLVVR